MHGARGVPPTDENKYPDEQIEQPYNTKIVLCCERFVGRGGYNWSLKLFATAGELVADKRPETGAVQTTGDVSGARRGCTIESEEDIAGPNAGPASGRIGGDVARLDAVIGVKPGDAVINHFIAAALVKVQEGKNHRSQRGKRQHDGS